MTMLRFSANLGFLWPDRPLLDRIDAAAQAGFEAIELHWPYDVPAERVRAACARHGLTVLGINTPIGERRGDFGLGAAVGRQAEFRAGFDQALRYAHEAGAEAVHVMAGLTDPAQKDEARRILSANLAEAAEQAADLTLLLEPINQRDRPGYFYSTLEEAASLIEEIGAANLKLMFDVYHVGVSQGDVLRRLQNFLPLSGHVQIAAVPSRAEPDEGEISYRAVFETLEKLDYNGWIGCEYKPRGDTNEGLRWLDALGISLPGPRSLSPPPLL